MSKILLISHIFPPAIDGGSRVIYKLGQQFETKGHTTLYLSSNCSSTDDFCQKKIPTPPNSTDKSKNIKLPIYVIFRKPLKFINLFIPSKSYLHQLFKVLQKGPIFKFFPFIQATIKIIKFKPNLIVAGPLPTTIVLYAHFLKFLINTQTGSKTKLLINASFHPTDPDFNQKPLIKSLQSANYLWTLTQFETKYFIKNFSINSNKIIQAGNGVDSEFLINNVAKSKTKKISFNILFIGSLSAHKRVDLLINSFSSLVKKCGYLQTIKLTIAGQKTLFYPQIEKIYNSLEPKIKSKINFVFNFPQNDLSKLIDDCDFLVLPSIQESFGLVLIESWARGKPVIVSSIPSLSELVKKSHGGLVFKTDDISDLQNQILKLINHPKNRFQYSQNGLKYVKTNYTWEKVNQKICQKIKLSY